MRWRRWLIGIGIAAALGAAAVGAAAWFLHSRSFIARIEDAARKQLPMELTIGSIAYPAPDLIEAHDVGISGPVPLLGARPPLIATVPRVLVRMDWSTRLPSHIDIDGIAIVLDRERLQALQRIIEAQARIQPPPSPPGAAPGPPRRPMMITARGTGRLGDALAVHDIAVALTATGPRFTGSGTALVDAHDGQHRPFRLSFRTEDRAAARAFAYTVEEGVIPAGPLVDAAAAIGLVPAPGPVTRRWLADMGPVDGRGTVVVSEPGHGRFTAQPRLAWNGNASGSGDLNLDRGRLTIAALRIDDPAVLRLEGRLDADLPRHRLRIQSSAWSPGPRLGIPGVVPVADLLALLPRMDLEADLEAERTVIGFQGRGQAWLRVETATGAPLRITGGELPLALAAPFVPPWLAINGGLASDGAGGTALSVGIGPQGIQGVVIDLRQARLGAGGWSAGPLDGRLRLRPAADGWGVAAEALGGGGSWTPLPQGGRLRLDLPAIEPLVARLQGPIDLPDLRGGVVAEAAVEQGSEGWRILVDRLRLRRAEMPDLLRDVDIDAAGRVVIAPAGDMAVQAEGRLSGGRLRLPGLWIDLAQRSPLATLAARVGADRSLTIDRLLARATGPAGQVLPGGWSAELGGRLSLRSGEGIITGAIDHADLGWLLGRLPGASPGLVAGEGACTFSAEFAGRRLVRVDGAVLPLAAALDLGSILRIGGVTGAVGFTLVP